MAIIRSNWGQIRKFHNSNNSFDCPIRCGRSFVIIRSVVSDLNFIEEILFQNSFFHFVKYSETILFAKSTEVIVFVLTRQTFVFIDHAAPCILSWLYQEPLTNWRRPLSVLIPRGQGCFAIVYNTSANHSEYFARNIDFRALTTTFASNNLSDLWRWSCKKMNQVIQISFVWIFHCHPSKNKTPAIVSLRSVAERLLLERWSFLRRDRDWKNCFSDLAKVFYSKNNFVPWFEFLRLWMFRQRSKPLTW